MLHVHFATDLRDALLTLPCFALYTFPLSPPGRPQASPTPHSPAPALTMTTKPLQQFLRRHGKGEGWVDEEWGPLRSPLTDFPPSKKCRGEGTGADKSAVCAINRHLRVCRSNSLMY